MATESKILIALLTRYDYAGVYDLLNDLNLLETDLAHIVLSCRYAINFDFESALDAIYKCSKAKQEDKVVSGLIDELKDLRDGDVDAVFSEMMENIKIQLINYEYIDFLGRVYRFKEGILKYMFIGKITKKNRVTLNMELMSKRYQLKLLRKKFKIFNNNICYGITTYFRKYQSEDYKSHEILKILNSEKMDLLIELRNDSIVGHGFKGVSKSEISQAFGSPYYVLDEFYKCLEMLSLDIAKYKYSRINEYLETLASEIKIETAYSHVGTFE